MAVPQNRNDGNGASPATLAGDIALGALQLLLEGCGWMIEVGVSLLFGFLRG